MKPVQRTPSQYVTASQKIFKYQSDNKDNNNDHNSNNNSRNNSSQNNSNQNNVNPNVSGNPGVVSFATAPNAQSHVTYPNTTQPDDETQETHAWERQRPQRNRCIQRDEVPMSLQSSRNQRLHEESCQEWINYVNSGYNPNYKQLARTSGSRMKAIDKQEERQAAHIHRSRDSPCDFKDNTECLLSYPSLSMKNNNNNDQLLSPSASGNHSKLGEFGQLDTGKCDKFGQCDNISMNGDNVKSMSDHNSARGNNTAYSCDDHERKDNTNNTNNTSIIGGLPPPQQQGQPQPQVQQQQQLQQQRLTQQPPPPPPHTQNIPVACRGICYIYDKIRKEWKKMGGRNVTFTFTIKNMNQFSLYLHIEGNPNDTTTTNTLQLIPMIDVKVSASGARTSVKVKYQSVTNELMEYCIKFTHNEYMKLVYVIQYFYNQYNLNLIGAYTTDAIPRREQQRMCARVHGNNNNNNGNPTKSASVEDFDVDSEILHPAAQSSRNKNEKMSQLVTQSQTTSQTQTQTFSRGKRIQNPYPGNSQNQKRLKMTCTQTGGDARR